MITQCGQQLGPRGVQEVVAAQSIGHLINFGKGAVGAAEMAERDGVVESDYRVTSRGVATGRRGSGSAANRSRPTRWRWHDSRQSPPGAGTDPGWRKSCRGRQVAVGATDRHSVPPTTILIFQQHQPTLIIES